MLFPHPLILVDVGGTNVRIAMVSEPGAPLEPVGRLATADFVGLAEATEKALAGTGVTPRSMIACGAGPVEGRSIKLTNAAWHIEGPQVARQLVLQQGLLLNDFEAQALSLPVLERNWVKTIGPSVQEPQGMRVVMGPGTGLGVAALAFTNGRFLPVASEGSHIDICPASAEEEAFWPHLERLHGRVTAETLLSGPGLIRLYRAMSLGRGHVPEFDDGAAIVEAALVDPESPAAETARLFWRLVARFAGAMAVMFLARGGVTITGGILPKMAGFLDEASFRASFEYRPPSDRFLRTVSTQLIVAQDVVLSGMAAIAAAPDLYWLDYQARCWATPTA